MAKIEMGFLFEHMLERSLAEKFATVRPGEIYSDEGIILSPDGVNPALACGEEYKCTWMSTRSKGTTPYTDEDGTPSKKFLHWFIQMKGYAKWLGTDTYLLRALHVNGDYTHPYQPAFLTHKIRFSEEEIEDNWQGAIHHATDMKML
jgi:hypothetical protein